MKIVVIGGTGLIGSRLVERLRHRGHEAVPASPDTGVDTLTGAGLDEVLRGAEVLVDVSNSPSFADDDVMAFFTTSTRHLLEAASAAGVGHYVALSVVGSDRLPDSGYLRAKVAQESLIKESGLAFSVLHATQFFEFVGAIADAGTVGGEVHLAPVGFQPIAADDVAATLTDVVLGEPVDGAVEVGGPARVRFDTFVGAALAASGDPRSVVADPHARYFGTELTDDSLVPGEGARLGATTYEEWADARLAG